MTRKAGVALLVLGLVGVIGLAAVYLYGSRSRVADEATGLGDLRRLVADTDPLTISVLGDSTGNDSNEWVALWAQHLAQTRSVSLHAWDADGQRYRDPVTLGAGRSITIWNGSQAGAEASFPATRVRALQPAEPDLVIYNFGHNNSSREVEEALTVTERALASRWGRQVPSVVVLQNPGLGEHQQGQAETVKAVGQWASATGSPTIDVNAAFNARDPSRLMADDAHPNAQGSQVWAEVVAAALG